MSEILIRNEPCDCPPGQCAEFIENDENCINRIAYAVTDYCEKCGSHTWHEGDNCLRCTWKEINQK